MKYISRAWRDTWEGQIKALFFLIVGGLLGLLFLNVSEGNDAAVEEIPNLLGTVVGSVGSLVVLFIWNLACAPYRVERDARIVAEDELKALKSRAAASMPRRLDEEQKAVLTSHIRRLGVEPESLNVLYFNASEECANFAADIGEAISSVPLECTVHSGALYSHDPKDRGIKIVSHGSKQIESLANSISDAFEKLGYHVEHRKPDTSAEQIFIYVARKS